MLLLKFYVTEMGRNPVRDFIRKQPWTISTYIGNRLRLLCIEFPHVRSVETKHLRGKLWEMKVRIRNKNYRIIYTVISADLLMLHGFIKKKGRAQNEIRIAEERLKDYLRRFKR